MGPLLAGGVARLVGVPQLLAVVAELRAAALAPARDLGAAGTAKGNHGIPATTWTCRVSTASELRKVLTTVEFRSP